MLGIRIKCGSTFLKFIVVHELMIKKRKTGNRTMTQYLKTLLMTVQQNLNLLKGLKHQLLSEPSLAEGEKVETQNSAEK